MNPYFEALLPIISLIITTLVGIGTVYIKKRFDISLDVADREAMHSALQTGVNAAISKISNEKIKEIVLAPIEDIDVKKAKNVIVEDAIAYAKTSVPGAIDRLAPGTGILTSIALSKLEQILRK